MSWRDRLQPASYAGAKFFVTTDDLEFGRRTVVHEYPGRNRIGTEDLGRGPREFSIEAYVIGDDYMVARDALIAALEKAGPAELVHPHYGAMRVTQVRRPRCSQSTREGGMATFSLQLIEAGDLVFPVATINTPAATKTAADDTLAKSISDYGRKFSVVGPNFLATAAERELDATLAAVEDVVGDVTTAIATEIRSPVNMATAIVDAVQQVADKLKDPTRAFNLYTTLFNAGSTSAAVPQTTATRKQQATNQEAQHLIVQRAAVAEAARASADTVYASLDDATTARDMLLGAIDAHMERAGIDDDVYQSFATLRLTVHRDLLSRGALLPRVVYYTPLTTLPALVIAHALYGDATRADEIIDRNRIRHPGAVTGGVALEVLNDA